MKADARNRSLEGSERIPLVRRARFLTWLGLAWHAVEAAVALAAGIIAGSIALVGFGADSLIEMLAGAILIWRFAGVRAERAEAEHPAHRLIAVSFCLVAVYVGAEALAALLGARRPEPSYLGIALACFTLVTMPILARAKAQVGAELGSRAVKSEGRQTALCAYLSAALLAGLAANALFGWWWADPAAALVIAALALREGRIAWRGDHCCPAC
jgi:divalent metal cation (Fe/Co/Zn/Cd) transporter